MASRLLRCAPALVLVLGCASWVQAQEVSVLQVTAANNGTLITCEPLPQCTAAGTQGGCDLGELCVTVSPALSACLPTLRPLAFEPFCCRTLDDCPRRAGLEATQCQVVAGDVSVCLYDEPLRNAYNLCRPLFTSLLEAVAACYATSPDPGALGSLAQGDCDGDGLANAQDLVDPCTRPFVPPDDAGVVLRDLGVDDDAAIIAPPFDQGATDAGGSSAAPGVGFQGGGGCHALAQGPSGSRAAGFALLVSLAGLIARRRQG